MLTTAIADLSVSRLCLGTMYFGTSVTAEVATGLLDSYVDAGGNFIDTANKYASWLPGAQGGESESLIGRWLRDRRHRNRLVIATKLGLAMPGVEAGLRAHQIEAQCEASLQRLGIDTIDLMYAHADDRNTPLEESLLAFTRLQRAGKIRHFGASNYAAWRLSAASAVSRSLGIPGFVVAQVRHSLLRADPWIPQEFPVQIPATPELLDCCQNLGLRVLAYSPLLGGIYDRNDRPLPPSYRTIANERRLAAIRRIARDRGVTANQLALAWLLSAQNEAIPVITASRTEQLHENLNALTITMTRSEGEALDDLRE
jgi:aryl-alcohol dehydrogenase-like predicted oxidoreductase